MTRALMLFNQKQHIDTVNEAALDQELSVNETLAHVMSVYSYNSAPYMLLILGACSLISIGVLHTAGHTASSPFMWAHAGSLIGCIMLALVRPAMSRQIENLDKPIIDSYLLLIAVFIGLSFAVSHSLAFMYFDFSSPTPNFLVVGLYFYTLFTLNVFQGLIHSRLIYGWIALLGAFAPVFFELLQNPSIVFSGGGALGYMLLYLCFFLYSQHELMQIRSSTALLSIRNFRLHKQSEVQQHQIQDTNKQLLEEINERKDTEQKLRVTQASITKEVEQRTKELQESNRKLNKITNSMAMAQELSKTFSWEWRPDALNFQASALEEMIGYSEQEVLTYPKHIFGLMEQDAGEEKLQTFLDFVAHAKLGDKLETSYQIRHKTSGELISIYCQTKVTETCPDTGAVLQAIGVCRNVTEENELLKEAQISKTIFDNSAEAIFLLDQDFNYVSVNTAFTTILGFSGAEVLGRQIFKINASDEKHRETYEFIYQQLRSEGEYVGSIVKHTKDGLVRNLQISINCCVTEQGTVNYIGIFTDITEQHAQAERLSYLSNYDPLCDLPNRRYFCDEVHRLIASGQDKFAVIRVNVDRFRVLNSTLGPDTGDKLIRRLGELLGESEVKVGMIAAFGADDFAVLIPELSLHNLTQYFDQLFTLLEKPLQVNEHEINLRVSAGASLFPQQGRQVDALLNRAEQALKRAKLNGGNSSQIYSEGQEITSLDKLKLENELRRGIINNELVVFYQPKIQLSTRELIGFEALVRWEHPERGLLSPAQFIDIASESGLIGDLGLSVLNQTCQQINQWHDLGYTDVKVAMNVEAQQLKRGNFLEILDKAMLINKLPGASLELEITENSLLDMPEKIAPLLTAVKGRGISIALDDFGTGYSSLGYLSKYPIDCIKIDRSFVKDLAHDAHSAAIVRAIAAMGQSLGIELVAEGVETLEQIKILESEGCQIAQGFYFGRPEPASVATELLKHAQARNKTVY